MTTAELVWMQQLLKAFDVHTKDQTLLFGDNEAALQIAHNPTFHERTKHIEVDCHFVQEKVEDKTIKLLPIRYALQLANTFTKPLLSTKLQPFLSKMGLKNIYSPSPS